MPIYEYKCPKCGKFEKLQDVDADDLEVCPKCNEQVKKLISLSASGDTLYSNSQEQYQNVIKPEVKEIVDKIRGGDEDVAANIFGEK